MSLYYNTYICSQKQKIDNMTTMYDTLLQLPLFQGINRGDLTEILSKIKLRFLKYDSGKNIVRSGDVCNNLIFLLKGEIISAFHLKKDFVFMEHLQAPHLIEPYSLFGMNIRYASSYTAHTKIDALIIEKSFIINELFNYEIFRLNYINIISNRAQILHSRLWNDIPAGTEQKIIQFIVAHSETQSGKRILKLKMSDFAYHLNDTRLNISKALNVFQEKELMILNRKKVIIPDVQSLIDQFERR